MRLTHHSTPSRSFIILTIIVLCTVYAALVLTRINRLYVAEETKDTTEVVEQPHQEQKPEQPAFPQVQPADTTNWNKFADQDYPITLLRPQGWNVTWNDDINDLYILYITRNNPRAQIRIYLTKTEPVEPHAFGKMNFTTKNGYQATNFYNNIYHLKYGEYYYVFDGNSAQNYREELAGIVNSVDLR